MLGGQALDGGDVQMVVVIVRDHDDVDRRQILESEAGGATRLGPANDTGLARSDQLGSVRMFTPSSWTSKVAWPTHVTVSAPRLSRIAGRSLATCGNAALRGANVARRCA
jgi:hypothetical protein